MMEIFNGEALLLPDYFPRIYFSFEEEDDFEFEPFERVAAVDCE